MDPGQVRPSLLWSRPERPRFGTIPVHIANDGWTVGAASRVTMVAHV